MYFHDYKTGEPCAFGCEPQGGVSILQGVWIDKKRVDIDTSMRILVVEKLVSLR